jgi:hypothetical protein
MRNRIKKSGGGLALQITKPARSAGLVIEDKDGKATYLADVLVYGVENVLIILDSNRISVNDRSQIVATAAKDTSTLYRGELASVEIAGNGYQVQLPGCREAGFSTGDKAPVRSSDHLLLVHDGLQGRLVGDLMTIRDDQLSR